MSVFTFADDTASAGVAGGGEAAPASPGWPSADVRVVGASWMICRENATNVQSRESNRRPGMPSYYRLTDGGIQDSFEIDEYMGDSALARQAR
jgi:hypothetical protein